MSSRKWLPIVDCRVWQLKCFLMNLHIEDEMTDQEQEIWAAIRYLDPDGEDKARDIAAFITVVALLLVALVVFVLLWVREVLV